MEKRIIIFATDYVMDRLTALRKVWGLTLLERCFFVSDKLGCEKIDIITSSAERIKKFLSSSRLSGPGISVKESPADINGQPTVYANCLYDINLIDRKEDIERGAYFKINSEDDLVEAEKKMWAKISKGATTKLFLRIINRPAGKQLVRLLANSRITPNQVSFISLLISVIGAACFVFDVYAWTVVGAVLVELAMCLDCVDGPLARLKNSSSDFGKWFDIISDNIKISLVYLGLTAGLFRHYGYYWIWMVGFLAQLGYLVHVIIWLTNENAGKKKKDGSEVTNAGIKHFKKIIDYVFGFFLPMENFYAVLLLGSVLRVNLAVLSAFAFFMNLHLVYVILIRYFTQTDRGAV